jgi:Domain of unknown function DUF11
VTVTDTLPAGTLNGVPTGTGWDCSASSGTTVNCTYPASATAPIAAGTTLPSITVPVVFGPDESGIFTTSRMSPRRTTPIRRSRARPRTPSQDHSGQSTRATVTIDVYPSGSAAPAPAPEPPPAGRADLVVTKTLSPKVAAVGDILTYTVTVTNRGPAAADKVVGTDASTGKATIVSLKPSSGSCTIEPVLNALSATSHPARRSPSSPGCGC